MSNIQLDDYLAISTTKARYCRFLDEKNWEGYADVFTEDVVLDTRSSGGPEMVGRDDVVQGVRSSIDTATTAHQVYSPEITMIDADTADVIWAMQDRVVWEEARARETGIRGLTGYGHYRERYTRCEDGQWRIERSTLTRLHMDFEFFAE